MTPLPSPGDRVALWVNVREWKLVGSVRAARYRWENNISKEEGTVTDCDAETVTLDGGRRVRWLDVTSSRRLPDGADL